MGDCEIFAIPDEFNDMVGVGNIEFLSLLGNLWDYSGNYVHSKLTSKSVFVKDPCVSILAGNTATGFSLVFLKKLLAKEFSPDFCLYTASLLVTGSLFPTPPSDVATAALVQCLLQIRSIAQGEAELSEEAKALLEYIYNEWSPVNDVRFESYCNRRFTHLLKLCLIHCAARKSKTIEIEDVILSNTVLVHAEHSMPRASWRIWSFS